jgi:hypothetical protein
VTGSRVASSPTVDGRCRSRSTMAWRIGCEKAPNNSDPLAIPYRKSALTESQVHELKKCRPDRRFGWEHRATEAGNTPHFHKRRRRNSPPAASAGLSADPWTPVLFDSLALQSIIEPFDRLYLARCKIRKCRYLENDRLTSMGRKQRTQASTRSRLFRATSAKLWKRR